MELEVPSSNLNPESQYRDRTCVVFLSTSKEVLRMLPQFGLDRFLLFYTDHPTIRHFPPLFYNSGNN
jgi:hypothetical protein